MRTYRIKFTAEGTQPVRSIDVTVNADDIYTALKEAQMVVSIGFVPTDVTCYQCISDIHSF